MPLLDSQSSSAGLKEWQSQLVADHEEVLQLNLVRYCLSDVNQQQSNQQCIPMNEGYPNQPCHIQQCEQFNNANIRNLFNTNAMTSHWLPDNGTLQHIVALLDESQRPDNYQKQQVSIQQLEQLNSNPEYYNYLVSIFSGAAPQTSIETRQSAGLLLKKYLHQGGQQQNGLRKDIASLSFIKESVLPALGNEDKAIRQTAGTIIANIALYENSLGEWDALVTGLKNALELGQAPFVEGALDAILKIAEESAQLFEDDVMGSEGNLTIGGSLIPLIVNCLWHQLESVSLTSLKVMIRLLPAQSTGITRSLNRFKEGLFHNANKSPQIKTQVCIAFTNLAAYYFSVLAPHLKDILSYMLQCVGDSHSTVSMEACEFITLLCYFAQNDPASQHALMAMNQLRELMPLLIPLLLNNMVYSDDDYDLEQIQAADAGDPEDDDLGWSREQADQGEYTVRKQSAFCLDKVAIVMGSNLLQVLLPLIEVKLTDENWKVKEASTLALGAVSKGSYSGLREHMMQLMQLLCNNMQQDQAAIRVISAWVLGRYLKELACEPEFRSNAQLQNAVSQCYDTMLHAMLDKNWKVQSSTTSSIAALIESLGDMHGIVESKAVVTLQQIMAAMSSYGRRNQRHVLDLLGQFAYATSHNFEKYAPQYLPAVLQQLYNVKWSDALATAILQCISDLFQSARFYMIDYIPQITSKSLEIVQNQVQLYKQHGSKDQYGNVFEEQILSAAIDMIGTMLFKEPSHIRDSLPPFNIFLEALQCNDQHVSASVYSLLSDYAQWCYEKVQPAVSQLMHFLVLDIVPPPTPDGATATLNNAMWAVSVLVQKLDQSLVQQYSVELLKRLGNVLQKIRISGGADTNAAIGVGKLLQVNEGLGTPENMFFMAEWCAALRLMHDDDDKQCCFFGLCMIINNHTDACVSVFPQIARAVASWSEIAQPDLQKDIHASMEVLSKKVRAQGLMETALAQLEDRSRQQLEHMGIVMK